MKPKPVALTLGWITTSAKYIFESRWHKIRQDQVVVKGREITYTYMEHAGAVFIVPVTREGKIVLMRSYRYTVDEWCWEVPAGGMGDRQGQSLESVALDEMREEAGYTAPRAELLGSFFGAKGVMDSRVTYFLARNAERNALTEHEELEIIDQIVELTPEEARAAIASGKINDGESAFAVLLALERL